MKRKPRKQIMKALEEIQYLVGKAKNDFLNDRAPDRAQKVCDSLEKAFNLCVDNRD